MKTLTFSPELNNDKEARRATYQARKQDHGTRGNSDSWKDPSDLSLERRKASVAGLAIADSVDQKLGRMTPRQLEKAATSILRSAGFVDDKEPEVSFLKTSDEDEEDTVSVYESNLREQDDETYVAADKVYAAYDAKSEVMNAQRDRRQQMHNAERVYEGHVNPDDEASDFTDGFHFTDRP